MLNSFSYSLPPEIRSALDVTVADWNADGRVGRIWNRDAGVWTGSGESNWLGWLDIAERELAEPAKYREAASDAAGFSDIVLLGMGGSSLCPEVLAVTFGIPNFHVLDSTVPAQVRSLEARLDLSKTLFVVASKSGSTLEPNCFKQYFFDRVAATVGAGNAGRHFIAVTDPGSKMQAVAEADGFRRILFGEPTVGGRFSALSVFGMTAAAVMGIDVEKFLGSACEMTEACRDSDAGANPGSLLGAILGVCHAHGRDKLTIFTSPELYDLGAWLEQLVAESTGKRGVAIIPVDREPLLPCEDYSEDRVFAYLRLAGSDDRAHDEKLDVLAAKGHPTVRIELTDRISLGQEFFRWEFATAVAGAVMGINPFDQPDVEAAKIEARKITDEYELTGELPAETPVFEADGFRIYCGEEYAESLGKRLGAERSLRAILDSHIEHLQENDYFALLAYVEMSAEIESVLQEIRRKVLERELTATCLGFGPRFLHSTGQAYKGGANNGVFLQITSDDAEDLPVPGQKYSFGVVKAAQARGDFQVLVDRGRRALRIHTGPDVAAALRRIADHL